MEFFFISQPNNLFSNFRSLYSRRDTFIQAPWSESRSYAREKIVGHNACTLCRSPVFLCPASGYSCSCCLDNDAGWSYQNVIIYGGLLVLGSLVLDAIARYLAGFDQNCINQMILRFIYQVNTVNSEFFAKVLFSRITLKGMFAMLKFRNWSVFYLHH